MLPQLGTTEDAIRFGRLASAKEAGELVEGRLTAQLQVQTRRRQGRLQEAMDLAVQGQFYREALEVRQNDRNSGSS